MSFPYRLVEDASKLASFKCWTEDVYADFLKIRSGDMAESEFNSKYHWQKAILSMDMTGFTSTAIQHGELNSLLRIVDAQKVVIPVLEDFGAGLIRCFADDIVALFDDPGSAVDAALETHRRIRIFNESDLASEHPTRCCAGIGYGAVFQIGPNLAQGDEMNRSSKLGEDIARANETLLTENAYEAVAHREDLRFEAQETDDQAFDFYRVISLD